MSLEIEPVEASRRLLGDALLLDVREPEEWAECHVAGAVHIPLDELPSRLAELPADREIICMCRSGRRSSKAQALMEESRRFTKVLNLSGGILRWIDDGLPVVEPS